VFIIIELTELSQHMLADMMRILVDKHHNALDIILFFSVLNTILRLILCDDAFNYLLTNSFILLVFNHTCLIWVCPIH
jgi:hypothetical protein